MKKQFYILALLTVACNKADLPVYISKAGLNRVTATSAMSATVASQDAFVRDAQYAAKNYNTTVLEVKGQYVPKYTGYDRNAFLSFDVPEGSYSSVKLKMYGKNTETTKGIAIAVSECQPFIESTVTWNTKPTSGEPVATTNVSLSGWYEWDITSIAKTGTLNLMLSNPVRQDDLVSFNSSEGTNKPQLVFSTADTPTEPEPPIAENPKKPAHIITCWFENKGYTQIIGSSSAPYINSLVKDGTLFTAAYATHHPSYPNYIAWFSGSNQSITNDNCISGAPKTAKNLFTALKAAGKGFVWFSEDLPTMGSGACSSGDYREKHNPTTIFSNVDPSANQPLSYLDLTDTSTFKYLPEVVSISPNMKSDMHDASVSYGDNWLKTKLGKLIEWCKLNNSVFIFYFDEDNKQEGNRIPVIAVGEHVKAGYKATGRYTHYSFSRLMLESNGVDITFHANIKNANPITEIFK